MLEKPIGRDLASARAINDGVGAVFDEHHTFRIDHYLGKETVQNLLVLRFANMLIEPIWSRATIDHVQITVAEAIGVEGRGDYYDKSGALRDMVQNHMLQLLVPGRARSAVKSMDADAIRAEKLKVLSVAGAHQTPEDVAAKTVRGQYRADRDGRSAGYRRRTRQAAVAHGNFRRASRRRSTIGAGPACRSICAPASA